MTTYSLRQPFTLEDAKALTGKTADITYQSSPSTTQAGKTPRGGWPL